VCAYPRAYPSAPCSHNLREHLMPYPAPTASRVCGCVTVSVRCVVFAGLCRCLDLCDGTGNIFSTDKHRHLLAGKGVTLNYRRYLLAEKGGNSNYYNPIWHRSQCCGVKWGARVLRVRSVSREEVWWCQKGCKPSGYRLRFRLISATSRALFFSLALSTEPTTVAHCYGSAGPHVIFRSLLDLNSIAASRLAASSAAVGLLLKYPSPLVLLSPPKPPPRSPCPRRTLLLRKVPPLLAHV